ncbi:hypothetical protein DPMN_007349 [Dreissena polymorpha]|uniref:Uncharacterized protein n=1 Tax=Dreissena polymorpha TaxID=45954 RepID=A0A9D4RWC5_DREPO|nr:hypothetical protein DPMN_007349 [Dreissena polymorpha]
MGGGKLQRARHDHRLSAWGFSRKTVDCPLKVGTEGLVLRVFCRPVVVGLVIFKKNRRLPPFSETGRRSLFTGPTGLFTRLR